MYRSTVRISALILCLIFSADVTFGQQTGKNGGNSSAFFNTQGSGGQLGHLQTGTFGQIFDTSSRWIGIGQPSGVSEQVYGVRIQDRGNQATFSLNGNGTKDLEIQWGSNAQSRLNFNFANSTTSVLPVLSLDPIGRVTASNRIRANSTNSNSLEFTEIGHGGASGYINTVGDGFLDFRHDGGTKMRLSDQGQLSVNTGGVDSNFKLWVNGRTRNTTGIWETSDRRFKKEIMPLRWEEALEEGELCSATEKLLQLEGVSYQFRAEKIGNIDMTFVDDKTQFGFIAQDMADLFPELVIQDDQGFYAVNYNGLIPVLVEGIKDQQGVMNDQAATIEALDDKIEKMEEQMSSLLKAIKRMPIDLQE